MTDRDTLNLAAAAATDIGDDDPFLHTLAAIWTLLAWRDQVVPKHDALWDYHVALARVWIGVTDDAC